MNIVELKVQYLSLKYGGVQEYSCVELAQYSKCTFHHSLQQISSHFLSFSFNNSFLSLILGSASVWLSYYLRRGRKRRERGNQGEGYISVSCYSFFTIFLLSQTLAVWSCTTFRTVCIEEGYSSVVPCKTSIKCLLPFARV